MKAFGGFLLVLIVVVIIVGVVGVISYNHEMAPTWAEIERQQALLDIAIAKQNAQSDIASHNQRNMAMDAGFWTAVLLMISFGGVFVWAKYDTRQEAKNRMVDGSFATKTIQHNGRTIVLDPNKSQFGFIAYDRETREIATDAAVTGPERQLEYANNVQRTRTMAAKAPDGRKPSRNELLDNAGYFENKARTEDAKAQLVERRLLARTPAQDAGEAMPIDFQPLTVQDALAQSTPDSWVLGQNQETGELFTLNIREVVHLGIVGATGTGKTMYVALLMMINAIRSKWRVIILDGKGGADWSKFGQYVEYYALDYTNVGAMLKQITDEYNQRQAKLNAAQANSVWELTPTPRPTMVMVDEFGAVMDSLKVASPAEHKKVSLDLGNLLRLSRSTGISMVFCDQDPSKWPSAMRANLPVNICFRLGGMKGNSVSEFNLHELDRVAHFQVNGERFHALPTYRVIDAMLPSIEYKKPKALLDVHSNRSPFTVQSEGGDTEDTPTPTSERLNDERVNDPTDLEALVWRWRDEHPRGTQADLRKDFEARQIPISKGHVFNCWHSWPGLTEKDEE